MNKLKELTWEVHQQAERTAFAQRLLKGLEPVDYHRYLTNQYEIYSALESAAENLITEFPDIARADKIKLDIEELEITYQLGYDPTLICPVVERYKEHVSTLDRDGLIAHLYVRHFGDMYGGQMIKKRNPGLGMMYEFESVEILKQTVRAQLTDDMADEANRCFEFAVELFKELSGE
jgi:heme oxygenase (biliverdin-producing, ferredoxin)